MSAGFITPAHYTMAQTVAKAVKGVAKRKRRKTKTTKKNPVARVKKAAKSVKKLVKGSAAAKAWGRKMKALRKK